MAWTEITRLYCAKPKGLCCARGSLRGLSNNTYKRVIIGCETPRSFFAPNPKAEPGDRKRLSTANAPGIGWEKPSSRSLGTAVKRLESSKKSWIRCVAPQTVAVPSFLMTSGPASIIYIFAYIRDYEI